LSWTGYNHIEEGEKITNKKYIRTLRAHASYYIPRLSSTQRLLLLFIGHVKIDTKKEGESSFHMMKCKTHGLAVSERDDDGNFFCPYCSSFDQEGNDNEEENILLSDEMTDYTVVELNRAQVGETSNLIVM
jgi:hypothetical protein